jgi:hypothetical protein
VVVGVVLALGASVVVPTQAAESALRDSRAAFFEQYPSLKEYASANGRDPRAWDPSTGISKRSWASAVADESVRIGGLGRALVVEPLHAEHSLEVSSPQSATPVTDIPTSDAFLLNSLPSSNRTIYLDFTGHSIAGTIWQDPDLNGINDYTNEQMQMPAFDSDGNAATFSTAERQVIIDTWSAVAEDYAPFNVNVTTQDPGDSALLRSSDADSVFGVRALITDSANVIGSTCGCGGVAYVDVFDATGYYTNTFLGPALNFTDPGFNGKTISDIVSHEVGHNVGLSHDGTTTQGYYGGRDGWAPIMGVGYYEPLVQFSNGSYTSANQTEDDFGVMAGNGISLRADDHGGTRGTATAITFGETDEGFITTAADVDYFSFTATGSSHDVSITSPSLSSNLDVQAQLVDSTGTVLSTTNPNLFRADGDNATGLDAHFTASTTVGETYYVTVDGVGYGPGTTTGYTDYGSRGEYRILVEGTPLLTLSQGTPTVSGTGVFGTSLTGSTGTWTSETTLSSQWYRNGSATGDTDSTYTILASDVGKTITYRVTGSKTGYTTATATSAGVTVTAATISPTGTPTASGTFAVGTILTGSTGEWLEGVSLSTSWLRNGSSAGDTDSSYTILPTDLGKTIVFRVVASKPGYTQVTANSTPVTVIAGTISPTATPTITGTAKVGKILTSTAGTWQVGVTLSRQWLRNGNPISSATGVTYKLKSADKGKRISVRVTGSSLGYTTVSQTSAATGRVKG